MIVLIFLSIVFELLFIHLSVEIYKEDKIHIPIFLIMITLIGTLLIRNFITLHTYLYNYADVDYWYSEVMIFLVSITLLISVYSAKRMNVLHKNNELEKLVKPFDEMIRSISIESLILPYIVVNENNYVVSANDKFKAVLNLKRDYHGDNAYTLKEMTAIQCSYENLETLTDTVQVIKFNDSNEQMVKLQCQSIDSGRYKIIYFEDLQLLKEELERSQIVKDDLDTFENILEVGKWTLNIDDDMIICSEKARRLLGMNKHSFGLNEFKKIVHPEDIKKIDTMVGKIVWISGRHVINLRMIINGEIKPVSVNFHTIVDEKGMPYQVVGFIQDQSHQNSELTEMLLQERSDYMATELSAVTQKTFRLLKALSKDETVSAYQDDIASSLDMMEALYHKFNKPISQKNLLNGDKSIEEIVTNLPLVGTKYKTELNLNADNSLVEIDDISFREIISHILTDIIRINNHADILISSSVKNQSSDSKAFMYLVECCIKKEDFPQNYIDDFLNELSKPSNGIHDTKLYHTHLIVKKYFGQINAIEDEVTYKIQIELPSIELHSIPERKTLNEILYIGDYELTRKIVSDYFNAFNVATHYDLEIYDASVIRHSVVIVDASVAPNDLVDLSRRFPNAKYVSLDRRNEFNEKNIYKIDQTLGIRELCYVLSKEFIMVPKMKVIDNNKELQDKLIKIDAVGINASESCINIGVQPILYLEDISLYNQYYGTIFSKLRALWLEGYHADLISKIDQMKSEANFLGCVSIEFYLETLIKGSYRSLSNPKSLIDFQVAFRSLEKAALLIEGNVKQVSKVLKHYETEEEALECLFDECIETLKQNKPIRSKELLQELSSYQLLKQSETVLLESITMIQKYYFEAAIEKIEKLKTSVLGKEFSM